MKVVLDTNIYISAIVVGGVCEKVFKLLQSSQTEIIISDFILWEINKVLKDKFKWSSIEADIALQFIKKKTILIQTSSTVNIIKKKKSDNKILECALDGAADLIITGDTKHILPLKNYKDIKIISPADFLKIF